MGKWLGISIFIFKFRNFKVISTYSKKNVIKKIISAAKTWEISKIQKRPLNVSIKFVSKVEYCEIYERYSPGTKARKIYYRERFLSPTET